MGKGGSIMILTKDELTSIITEISENIYEKSNIDLEKNKKLEPIISNMRYETELIIAEAVKLVIDILSEYK